MTESEARRNPDDEPEEPGNGTEATLAGTGEPAFPQLDVDGAEEADDEDADDEDADDA